MLEGLRRLLPDGGTGHVRVAAPPAASPTAPADSTFDLPDLGEGLTEAEVLEWKVAVGDTVAHDQVLAEVETAKSAVTLPSPYAGTVTALHCAAGEVVRVGAPLLTVAETGSGAVLTGYGTARAAKWGEPGGLRVPLGPAADKFVRGHRDTPTVTIWADTDATALLVPRQAASAPSRRPARSPTALKAWEVPPLAAPAESPSTSGPSTGPSGRHAESTHRLRSLAAARRALLNGQTLPAGAPAARASHGTGLMPLLARACLAALAAFPELNARVDTDRGELIRLPEVHLGFAAQTPHGLVVPVVRDAGRLAPEDLAAELRRLTDLARRDALPVEHRTGGTFTLNNYGVFGVDGATPILNHPQAAMLGVGRITDRPWAVDGRLEVRGVVHLSLTFDHRVCDGGTAAGFLRHVVEGVTAPEGLPAGQ
nr:dihydrolipoamide acetyltransferase family protein [Kutzneria buriramensis]WKX16360.1 dihydrolipoamide acetyltransferase family protein [Kutzneria buriramensis]